MAKRPRGNSKQKRAVRPPVIDLKAEETKSAEATGSKAADVKKDAGKAAGAAEKSSTTAGKPAATAEKTGAAANKASATTGKASSTAGKMAAKAETSSASAAKSAPGAKSSGNGAPVKAASGGRGKMMAGGLALLTLAAIAFGGWLYRGYGAQLFGGPQAASLTAIEEQLSALEAAAKANAAKLEALSSGGNTSELEAMTKVNAGKLDALGASVSAAEEKIAALEASAGAQKGAGAEELAAVQKSVAELRTALSSASGQETGAGQAANKVEIDKLAAGFTELGGRIGKAEEAIAAVKPADVSGLETKVAEIGDRIGKAEAAIAEVKPVDLSGLEGKLGGLETELAGLKAQQNELATQTRSELGEAFAKLSGKVASSEPFSAELEALAAEAPAAPGIKELQQQASTGVPSIGDLADALGAMEIPVAGGADGTEAAGGGSSGGIMGALKAKLSTVVKIRKLDEADWPAVLSQAADLVRGGQLEQARSLLSGQPGDALPGLADWDKQADTRSKVDRAMAVLSKEVLGRLAATGQSG